MKPDIRPLLHSQIQVDPCRRYIDQRATLIFSQILMGLVAETCFEPAVIALDPARGRHGHRFKPAVDAILVFQAVCDHIELQDTHRPQYQVIVLQRPKQLGRTLLTQLVQPLLQCPPPENQLQSSR